MKPKIALVLLVATTLISTGCGSNGPTADDSTTTLSQNSSTSTSTDGVIPPVSSDETIAGRVTLTQGDLDESWTSHAPKPENAGVTAGDKQLATCLGRPDPRINETANVQGYAFVRVDDAITSSVQLLRSKDEAALNLQALQSARMIDCLKPLAETDIRKQFGHLLGNGATFQTSVSPIADIEAGNTAFGWRVTIDMTISGQTTRLYGDLVGFQYDRLHGTIYFSFAERPPALDLQNELLASMRQRARSASVGT